MAKSGYFQRKVRFSSCYEKVSFRPQRSYTFFHQPSTIVVVLCFTPCEVVCYVRLWMCVQNRLTETPFFFHGKKRGKTLHSVCD